MAGSGQVRTHFLTLCNISFVTAISQYTADTSNCLLILDLSWPMLFRTQTMLKNLEHLQEECHNMTIKVFCLLVCMFTPIFKQMLAHTIASPTPPLSGQSWTSQDNQISTGWKAFEGKKNKLNCPACYFSRLHHFHIFLVMRWALLWEIGSRVILYL